MTDIWYVGASSSYTITSEQWAERGTTGDTVAWSADNAWSVPQHIFSPGQIALLQADNSFLLGQDGPRLRPGPSPTPLRVSSLVSAHAYYAAIQKLVQDFGSLDGLQAAVEMWSKKTPLVAHMRPSSTTPYPTDDVVSYTVSGTDPAYASQKHYFFKDADAQKRWRYGGVWFDYANNPVNQISGADPGDFNNSTSYEVEFYVNGSDVTVWMRSAALSDFRIFVDDAPLTSGWDLSTAEVFGHNYAKIQFATPRVRKIRLLASGFLSFTGVLVPGSASIWAAPPRFRVAITGDSYIQGGHWLGPLGHLMGAGLANQLAILTGWEVLNLGQGGTGYLNDSEGTIGKSPYGSPARMAALAELPPLDLFIAFGTGNDSGHPTGTVLNAANTFWNAVKTARPQTPIVVVGVQSGTPTGFDPTLMDTLNTALIAAAEANPNVAGVVDMRTEPWWTGTGNEGSPANDGNADFFISADEVHPSGAGYENLGLRLTDALGAIRA